MLQIPSWQLADEDVSSAVFFLLFLFPSICIATVARRAPDDYFFFFLFVGVEKKKLNNTGITYQVIRRRPLRFRF